jgi:hypothetical protein
MSKFKGALDAIKHRQKTDSLKTVGKRNNPNYQQLTAYLERETYHALKVALAEDQREMSALFEELIRQWLKSRTRSRGK